ncbi:MAG: AzlC family protein [Spirochaetaceae bacterium 4572_7]|nr:MAG: AzlC family protein [Spirochaetaceae bacterium 4572_7]
MIFHRKTVLASLKASTPVFFGYMAIGFAFGFLLVKAGFPWYLAPIMCITIFAGAAQFVAIGLLNSDKSIFEMGLAILLINARHMVYGISLLDRFKSFKKLKKYLIYGLTDETYALLTTLEAPIGCKTELFDFWITAFNQSYWIIGSTLGAILGSVISFDFPGIDFALTALFIVLTIEQIKAIKKVLPFLIPIIIVALIYILKIDGDVLIITIVLSSVASLIIGGREK